MSKKNGFSLLELCFVLLLTTVLLSLAWSGFHNLTAKLQADRQIQHVLAAIQSARVEALQRNTPITVCSLNTAGQCVNDQPGSITVFLDPLQQHQLNDPQQILQRITVPAEQGWLVWHGFTPYLTIQANADLWYQQGMLTYCSRDADPHHYRGLIVAPSGRLRLTEADSMGVHQDAGGKPLLCDTV